MLQGFAVLSSVFNPCCSVGVTLRAHPEQSKLTAIVPSALLCRAGIDLSQSSAFVLGEIWQKDAHEGLESKKNTEKGSFIIYSKNTGRSQMKSEFRRGERHFPPQTQKHSCPWRGLLLDLGQGCALQMIFFLSNLNLTSGWVFKPMQCYCTD